MRLSLISADSADTAKRVFSNQADVGIVAGNCDYPDLEVVPINEEDFVMVASPAVVQGRSYMEVLTGHPFLRNGVLEKLGEKIMEEVAFTPPAVIECSSEETIKQTAIHQGGVCAVGEDVVSDELATGELVVIYRFRKKMVTSLIFSRTGQTKHRFGHSFPWYRKNGPSRENQGLQIKREAPKPREGKQNESRLSCSFRGRAVLAALVESDGRCTACISPNWLRTSYA
ncbi:substrate-binding domain-containing protein [Brevibacillus nitrificans]|uniref:substrate-binding domain-containing protein n=1 Tax=Brevibacillus nitrificans TaxID=651560 RepID=UPI0028677AD4|nr:substrate-binding domain-containing protein [Brevibacillus nitrificans]MDR7316981.1 hypothetical protein [Brevibacillus nitrificans]